MKREEHERECMEKLGKPFTEVHRWLDEFAFQLHMRHRHKRHHLVGIEEVRKLFGDEAAEAAKLHILSDLEQEGMPRDEELIPRDEKHWLDIGLF